MVGSLVLENCLKRDDVAKVTVVTRRKTGITHPKLVEVVHTDFRDYSTISEYIENQDLCIYCLGVYTGQVPPDKYREITVDYLEAFANAVRKSNEKTTFCYLSGQGADQKEKSRMLFARNKGIAENILINLKFDQTYIFRPGYIYPSVPRKEPNFSYLLMRILYKGFVSKLYPNAGVPSETLANAMVEVGLYGSDKTVYENLDIRNHKKQE